MYGGMSGVEADLNQTQLPLGAEVRKIFVDTSKPLDSTFEKYGHIFYNMLVQDGHARWVKSRGIKYWEQDGTFRSILPMSTPVYPFEPMLDDLEQVIQQNLEVELDGQIKKARFEIHQKYFTHNGFSMFVDLRSPDIRRVIKGSYVKDDIVQLGIVVRNGIKTGVSLGADFMTYRLVCQNGAIGRGENFGSISIRHVGDQNKMIEAFREGIPVIIQTGQRILDYYEMATAFRFDEAMAKKIYKRTHITEKYFPQYFGIDKDQKDPDKQVNLTNEARGLSLWEVFNDITQNLTRSFNTPDTHIDRRGREKAVMHLGFSGFSKQTRQLHQVLTQIIDGRGRPTTTAEVA